MVGGQGQQDPVDEQNVLEVVDDALAVQKVHGGAEEVPVQRLGEAQAAGLAGDVGYRNDLLEADDLDGGDDGDDVEVAGAEGEEEAADHDQRPGGAHDEVCLLLLILGLLGDERCLGSSVVSGGARRRGRARTDLSTAPLRVGLAGCEPDSLNSDMLMDGRRARPLLALLCANLTSLRGRAMADVWAVRPAACGSAGRIRGGGWRAQRGEGSGAEEARRGGGGTESGVVVVWWCSGAACPGSCKSAAADQKRCRQRRHSARSSRLRLPPVAHVKPRRRRQRQNASRLQPGTTNDWAMLLGRAIGSWRCSNVRRRLRLLRP